MLQKVYVIGRDRNVHDIFDRHPNYEVLAKPDLADILVFTGGEDINPKLYGEKNYRSSYNDRRDEIELNFYNTYRDRMYVGICRGAQLLNVLSGGKLYQDVDNHTGHDHKVHDTLTGMFRHVNSCHHQMMIEGPGAMIIACANESTRKANENGNIDMSKQSTWSDNEVIYYDKTNAFCFQAHPEWSHLGTRAYFFELLDELCGG